MGISDEVALRKSCYFKVWSNRQRTENRLQDPFKYPEVQAHSCTACHKFWIFFHLLAYALDEIWVRAKEEKTRPDTPIDIPIETAKVARNPNREPRIRDFREKVAVPRRYGLRANLM